MRYFWSTLRIINYLLCIDNRCHLPATAMALFKLFSRKAQQTLLMIDSCRHWWMWIQSVHQWRLWEPRGYLCMQLFSWIWAWQRRSVWRWDIRNLPHLSGGHKFIVNRVFLKTWLQIIIKSLIWIRPYINILNHIQEMKSELLKNIFIYNLPMLLNCDDNFHRIGWMCQLTMWKGRNLWGYSRWLQLHMWLSLHRRVLWKG